MQRLTQETKQETGQQKEAFFHKWFTRDNLIILVLAGVLLFIIGLPTKEKAAKEPDYDKTAKTVLDKTDKTVTKKDDVVAGQSRTALEEYALKQETKLVELLESMEGVGKVEVMLTFSASEELVVEKDAPTVRSNTVEKDSAGGNRTVSQFDSKDTTVYSSVSGDSTPYVIKTLSPRVEGVFVVAQGAGKGKVSQNISEAVQALFGVEVHRVKVVEMNHISD